MAKLGNVLLILLMVRSLLRVLLLFFCLLAPGLAQVPVDGDAVIFGGPVLSEVRLFAISGEAIPRGWLLCDGTCYSIDLYPELYESIGTQYTSELISANKEFCVPDLRDKTVKATRNPVGGTLHGENFHFLEESELPAHSHDVKFCPVADPDNASEEPRDAFLNPLLPRTSMKSDIGNTAFVDEEVVSSEFASLERSAIDLRQPFVSLNYYIAHTGSTCSCSGRSGIELIIVAGAGECEPAIDDSLLMGFIRANEDLHTFCEQNGVCGSNTVQLTRAHIPPHSHRIRVTSETADGDASEASLLALSTSRIYVKTCDRMNVLEDYLVDGNTDEETLDPITTLPNSPVSDDTGSTDNNNEIVGESPGSTGISERSWAPVSTLSVEMESMEMSVVAGIKCDLEDSDRPQLGELRMTRERIESESWIPCDGRIIKGSERLVEALKGTPFADGELIRVPDLSGAVPLGASRNQPLGSSGGRALLTLTASNLPKHRHIFPLSSSSEIFPGEEEEKIIAPRATRDVLFTVETLQSESEASYLNIETVFPSEANPSSFVNVQRSSQVFYYLFVGSNVQTVSPSTSPVASLSASPVKSPNRSLDIDISIQPTFIPSDGETVSIRPSNPIRISQPRTVSPFIRPNGPIEPPAPIGSSMPSRSRVLRPSMIPSASSTCRRCYREVIEEPFNVPSNTVVLDISDSSGNLVGSVTNVETPRSTLIIENINPTANLPVQVFSPIVNVTIFDEFGNSITKFDEPITICLETDIRGGDGCLSYYDESEARWICQDPCLEDGPNGQKCGKTNHLTSFAVLLTGSGMKKECDSEDSMPVLFWISLGLSCGAILIVILFIAIAEVKRKVRGSPREEIKITDDDHQL